MTATLEAVPDEREQLGELELPKLTLAGKAQNLVYSLLGLHAGVFIVTFFFICLLEGRYRYGGTDYSLAAAWNNLPVTLHVTSWLGWVHVGGAGGLGGWIVSHWDMIYHVGYHIAIGIVGFTFIALILGLGAGKKFGKPKLTDKVFLKANKVLPIFANRYQGHSTTLVQYAFLPVAMLIAALPGVAVSAFIIYGLASRHWITFNPVNSWHLEFARVYLAASVWQPILIGVIGAHFFARFVTLKPGEDTQRYFLEKRLDNAYDAEEYLDIYEHSAKTEDDRNLFTEQTSALRKTTPSWWEPPIYKARYKVMLENRVPCPEHGNQTKIIMPGLLAFMTFATIVGAYWYAWLPKHGGGLP